MAGEPYNVSPGDRLTAGWMNAVVGSIKRRNNSNGRGVQWSGGGPSVPCPLGELYTDTSVQPAVRKLRGGVVIVGDKNFTVPGYNVNIASARTVSLYLQIPLTVNTDDDGNILLPGVRTSSWIPAVLEIAGAYPDNSNPSVPDGDGTIVIPLGELTVLNNNATFVATGCGGVVVDHCAGTLTYVRQ